MNRLEKLCIVYDLCYKTFSSYRYAFRQFFDGQLYSFKNKRVEKYNIIFRFWIPRSDVHIAWIFIRLYTRFCSFVCLFISLIHLFYFHVNLHYVSIQQGSFLPEYPIFLSFLPSFISPFFVSSYFFLVPLQPCCNANGTAVITKDQLSSA